MNRLISDNLIESLLGQLSHEKFNANLYLYIAGYLKNKGLNNLAKHFMDQHDEETEHSLIIFNLLTDLSANIIINEINEVSIPINYISDIAKAYLDREILTTESLNEIKNQAIEENNPVVEERMREMIKLQQNEYAEATDFMDKSILIGDDWKFALLWDLGVD
jgi:ferritin